MTYDNMNLTMSFYKSTSWPLYSYCKSCFNKLIYLSIFFMFQITKDIKVTGKIPTIEKIVMVSLKKIKAYRQAQSRKHYSFFFSHPFFPLRGCLSILDIGKVHFRCPSYSVWHSYPSVKGLNHRLDIAIPDFRLCQHSFSHVHIMKPI